MHAAFWHMPVAQSESAAQALATAQAGQGSPPPQSTSVSAPLRILSVHDGARHVPLPQMNDAQSE
jgi:hypothetical protein